MPVIGVALPVPEPWATQLQSYRAALGDQAAVGTPTHITLVPPISVDADELVEVERHLRAVADGQPGFRVHLRGTGTFRPVSDVVFINLVEGISRTEQLAAAARQGVLDVAISYPFHPHVTVGHDVSTEALDRAFAELADFECEFDVSSIHLSIFEDGAGWQTWRDFELTR